MTLYLYITFPLTIFTISQKEEDSSLSKELLELTVLEHHPKDEKKSLIGKFPTGNVAGRVVPLSAARVLSE